jgi:hypothetical protein
MCTCGWWIIVEPQVWSTGGDTDASEMFGIGRDRENGLARCLEQQIVDHRFILISEVSDRRRQREDDVEVGHKCSAEHLFRYILSKFMCY